VGREISTGQGTVAVLCAGKATVGLALHQLSVTGSYLQAEWLRKRDEHPTYTPVRCIALYYFNFILSEAIH